MAYSRFRIGVAWRLTLLFFTIVAAAWMLASTPWYMTIAIFLAAAILQAVAIVRYTSRASREVARFLDALSVDDVSQSFAEFAADPAHHELGAAIERVLTRLRANRFEYDQQAHYLQTLINHVPVALLSLDDRAGLRLLNMAARRLFDTVPTELRQLARYGQGFVVGFESLRPGGTAILRMERSSGSLLLKAAATGITAQGSSRLLISLQNIDNEMSARELEAWQTVIRVMAHEVMNSLTPVSSLASTAHGLVSDALGKLTPDDPLNGTLADARDALETMARRSEGLLHFVRSHRRLTKPLAVQMEVAPVERLFARIQRLLSSELAGRDIRMTAGVEPTTLELAMDADLLDQALINLVRNALEALRDTPAGRIQLSASREADGRIVVAVADNGPGIPPEQREKIFVPFFTTKRRGSGIGLTLVRQIAAAHGASVDVIETTGGGATVRLRF